MDQGCIKLHSPPPWGKYRIAVGEENQVGKKASGREGEGGGKKGSGRE